jgi:hypothetical protein
MRMDDCPADGGQQPVLSTGRKAAAAVNCVIGGSRLLGELTL